MYTQCPECGARFRVGAGELRAARGTVRCGRCGSAFNALTWLSDNLPPSRGVVAEEPADELAAADEQLQPVTGVEFHFTANDIESIFVEPRARPVRPDALEHGIEVDAPDSTTSPPGAPMLVESEDRPFEDITLEGEMISVESILGIEADEPDRIQDDSPTDEFEVLRDVPESAYPEDEDSEPLAAATAMPRDAAPQAAPAATAVPASPASPRRAPEAAPSIAADHTLRNRWSTAAAGAPGNRPSSVTRAAIVPEPSLAAALDRGRARTRPGRSSLGWSIGGLLLAVALLAQVTHQFRQELARNPQIGPLLKEVYARIGRPLSPNWDLAAFELRQWGTAGAPDANGQLTVRASLTNRAAFAQPHPILRLELDDRFGDSIAVRDFEPAEYLKNASEAPRLLGPGASAEAELVVVDPGRDAVGYQLDVCLRETAETLRCARGPG
jgi:predicted Zn finger-like uncharacterized protein